MLGLKLNHVSKRGPRSLLASDTRHLFLWHHCPNFAHRRPLQWRHNGCDSVSSHRPHDCLLNRLFRRISKKTSKLRVTGLCAGNSPGTGEFPAQMASNAENVSIWWRHHAKWWPFCAGRVEFDRGLHLVWCRYSPRRSLITSPMCTCLRMPVAISELILGLRPANEKRLYFVLASLVGCVQA